MIFYSFLLHSRKFSNLYFIYTFKEQLLRVEAKHLFGQFSLKQTELLSNIVKQAALYSISKNTDLIRKNCVRLLAAILPYKTALFDIKNIIEIDLFHFLVSLCLSMPNLYDQATLRSVANGGINDSNIFKLVFQAHCLQIMVIKIKSNSFYHPQSFQEEMPNENEKQESLKIYEYFIYLINLIREKKIYDLHNSDKLPSDPMVIYRTLKHALMPFLRCSALFFANLTDLCPSSIITSDEADFENNFDKLLRFLGISTNLASILDIESETLKVLCNTWLSNVSALSNNSNDIHLIKTSLVDYPFKVNELIELPSDFVDLISMTMTPHVYALIY
jgi:hypothetical protein